MKNITISNVISNSQEAIIVAGYINSGVISNVVNRNPECPCVSVRRENGLTNVQTYGLCSAGNEIIERKDPPKDYPI